MFLHKCAMSWILSLGNDVFTATMFCNKCIFFNYGNRFTLDLVNYILGIRVSHLYVL